MEMMHYVINDVVEDLKVSRERVVRG